MKMQTVMSIRLPRQDIDAIEELAAQERIDKSTAVRELVEKGLIYHAISEYRKGKISIGKAAEMTSLSISEIMDLLAGLGIESKIEVEDYLAGLKAAEKVFKE